MNHFEGLTFVCECFPFFIYGFINVLLLWFKITLQGPPGKDGLPGHPGQRGEVVSWTFKMIPVRELVIIFYLDN